MTNNFKACKQKLYELEAILAAVPVKKHLAKLRLEHALQYTGLISEILTDAEKREAEGYS